MQLELGRELAGGILTRFAILSGGTVALAFLLLWTADVHPEYGDWHQRIGRATVIMAACPFGAFAGVVFGWRRTWQVAP